MPLQRTIWTVDDEPRCLRTWLVFLADSLLLSDGRLCLSGERPGEEYRTRTSEERATVHY